MTKSQLVGIEKILSKKSVIQYVKSIDIVNVKDKIIKILPIIKDKSSFETLKKFFEIFVCIAIPTNAP